MLYIVVMILLVVTVSIAVLWVWWRNLTHSIPSPVQLTSGEIPRTLVATHWDKKRIPSKVYDNWKTFAPNYTHVVFDDEEALRFLQSNYPPQVADTFQSLRGAHKADLFRYCYLYQKGGVYIDIKTELIRDMDDLFKSRQHIDLFTVLSIFPKTIYQGIIAAKPGQPFFLSLIDSVVKVPKIVRDRDYLIFTRNFYRALDEASTTSPDAGESTFVQPGHASSSSSSVYLFQEICTTTNGACYDGLDRYNRCCYVYDKKERVFKTRYSDYPW